MKSSGYRQLHIRRDARPQGVIAYATIENAAFKDGGSGRLLVVLDGQVRITKEQVQTLSKQVKERIAAR